MYLLLISTLAYYFIVWVISRSPLDYLLPSIDLDTNTRSLYNPHADNSHFESFQHVLLLWNSILVYKITFFREYRRVLFLSIFWFCLAIDDAFLVHDSIGSDFIRPFYQKISPGIEWIRYKDLGELTYWLFILILLIIFTVMAWPKAGSKAKGFIYKNLGMFFVLGFYAVVIDMVGPNIIAPLNSVTLNGLFTFIEEFGEISVVIAAFLFLFYTIQSVKLGDEYTTLFEKNFKLEEELKNLKAELAAARD